jgi:hypothetical protein
MGVQTEQALSQAFELIEADKLEEARAILKPILDVDKDNPDVWWLYAHAVTDPEAARLALSNVRRLDPNYLNAGELLYTLEKQSPDLDLSDILSEKDPSFLPTVPSTLPGLPGSKAIADDDWNLPDDEDEEEDSYTPIFRRPIFLLALGTIIFAIITSLVILQPSLQIPNNNAISATSTNQSSVAETPTVELSQAVEVTVTEGQLTTPAPVDNNGEFDNLNASLKDFSIADNGIVVEQTTLGDTVVVSVCTEPGVALRETLPEVLKAIAKESSTLSTEIQAISVRMIDCANNASLLMLGVPMSDAQAYQSGSIDDDVFQSKWQPIS